MPLSGFGALLPSSQSDFPTITLLVNDVEIKRFKDYSVESHFLTPSDSFRFTLGDEIVARDVIELLKGGSKVQLLLNGAVQMSGYIDAVDIRAGSTSGTTISVEGRDTMSPVLDSQIDPDTHYPDKTPLDKLLRDIFSLFGFNRLTISNEDNIDVAAGRGLRQKRTASPSKRRRKPAKKALKQYPVPKSKPQHNDSYFVFLSRITHRLGLWMWPTVDGEGVVVGRPDYDQDPSYQLRRKFDGKANNIQEGGIRRDYREQPSFIMARGSVPGRQVEHTRTRVIIGNPYDDVVGRVLGVRERDSTVATQLGAGREVGSFNPFTAPKRDTSVDDVVARLLGAESRVVEDPSLTAAGESGTFSTVVERRKVETLKWVEVIPPKPIQIANPFAASVAKPRYLRDLESKTLDELERFARRQMSLCIRKAFVAKYTVMGHAIDGVPIQVDTIVDVDDEIANYRGPLWILSRTFSGSRSRGVTTEIEAIPLHALEF